MNKKIFITRHIPDIALKMFAQKGYEVDVGPWTAPPPHKKLLSSLSKKPYDAVITLLTDHVDAEAFAAMPKAKIVANYAVGFDNIDLAEAKRRNVFVTNTPGNYSDTIAEHTIALMLALTTRVAEADRFVRAGKYQGWSPDLFVGTDLRGATLGLIGVGRIGESVAHFAYKGFGAKIVYHDIVRNENVEKECAARYVGTHDEVLKEADIVSLHVPLNKETRHLIDHVRLQKMKPTAYLINTSRGPVVDEHSLVDALRAGRIRGAGLDVFEFEPKLVPGLSKLQNVVLTPHIASASESARNEMATIAAQNVIDCLEGRVPQNKIDI